MQNRSNASHRGFALLMMLSLIIIALTTAAVLHLSANSNQIKQQAATLKAMTQARDAILAYALTQQTLAKPPGTIPCPDTDHDGKENIVAGVCPRRGLIPYKDLNIPELFDGTGAPLWYAVASNYGGTAVLARNSSQKSLLALDGTAEMVFIIIAPGVPLNGQQPTVTPVAPVTDFLEGDNSDGTLDSYTNLQDATHNDILLGVSTAEFWPSIEKLVLEKTSIIINAYKTACGQFPWAANFGTGASINLSYEGNVPLTSALPTNWGAGCAPSMAATQWLPNNWTGMLYYKICNLPAVNPPTASCLKLYAASGAITNAKVIAIAPGIPLTNIIPSQNRASLTIPNFFEGRDALAAPKLNYDNITPTPTDNDLITIVAP